MWMRNGLKLMALAAGSLIGLWVAGPPMVRAEALQVAITAEPLELVRRDPAVDRVGPLIWRGGLVLRAKDPRFGGISDLHWEEECGRLLAVTDTGAWLVLVPEEKEGRLTGMAAGWIAALRDWQGAAPARKAEADSEALVRGADGTTTVWFERRNAGQRYPQVSACRPESLNAPADAEIAPPAMRGWPLNGGPEAAAPLADGQIVLAEQQVDAAGRGVGLIIDAQGQELASVSAPWPAGFVPTAMQRLAAGETTSRYLVLLRKFSPLTGVAARLMLLDVPHSGGALAPVEFAELRSPVAVDNMEGMAVRREADEIIIYLVSDDNFNPLQRTLLMKFALPAAAATLP